MPGIIGNRTLKPLYKQMQAAIPKPSQNNLFLKRPWALPVRVISKGKWTNG